MAQLFEEGKQSFRVLLDFLVPGPLCVLIPTYVSSLIYSRYRQVAPGYIFGESSGPATYLPALGTLTSYPPEKIFPKKK